MPEYLIIILTIAAIFVILACSYGIYLIYKISIVNKKINFLVEDLTFKLDALVPFFDSLIKLSAYVDVLDVLFKKNIDSIKSVIENNKKNLTKFSKQLLNVLNDNK